MAIEPIKGFYVHDEETNTDGVALISQDAIDGANVRNNRVATERCIVLETDMPATGYYWYIHSDVLVENGDRLELWVDDSTANVSSNIYKDSTYYESATTWQALGGLDANSITYHHVWATSNISGCEFRGYINKRGTGNGKIHVTIHKNRDKDRAVVEKTRLAAPTCTIEGNNTFLVDFDGTSAKLYFQTSFTYGSPESATYQVVSAKSACTNGTTYYGLVEGTDYILYEGTNSATVIVPHRCVLWLDVVKNCFVITRVLAGTYEGRAEWFDKYQQWIPLYSNRHENNRTNGLIAELLDRKERYWANQNGTSRTTEVLAASKGGRIEFPRLYVIKLPSFRVYASGGNVDFTSSITNFSSAFTEYGLDILDGITVCDSFETALSTKNAYYYDGTYHYFVLKDNYSLYYFPMLKCFSVGSTTAPKHHLGMQYSLCLARTDWSGFVYAGAFLDEAIALGYCFDPKGTTTDDLDRQSFSNSYAASIADGTTDYNTKIDAFNALVFGDTVQNIDNVPSQSESFIFFTDPHDLMGAYTGVTSSSTSYAKNYQKYIAQIAYSYENSHAKFVVCGGDWFDGDLPSEAMRKMNVAQKDFERKLAPFYNVIGNHDTNYQGKATASSERYTTRFSPECMRKLWFGDKHDCYYHFDGDNTSFYVLDTEIENTALNWNNDYGTNQVKWFAGQLAQDDAEHIAMFSHIYFYDSSNRNPIINAALQCATAFNKRMTYTIGGETFDFSQKTGRVEFLMSGHSHADHVDDYEYNGDTIPVIRTLNAGNTTTTSTDVYGGAATPNFDMVFVDYDSRKITCIRQGLGDDRVVDF